ncbi:hypothetical protein BBI17_005655 [Phytophthora kernoviae]|nr:hypothetical protein BBI17_005655 [Phytophthora kernoviae]
MHYQQYTTTTASVQVVQVRSLKRRRGQVSISTASALSAADTAAEQVADSSLESGTTSGESSDESSDDGSNSSSYEEEEAEDEEEVMAAAKRRRRADLDGLKKSVRRMEAQVVDASAQLRDLRALVAQVVARRQV